MHINRSSSSSPFRRASFVTLLTTTTITTMLLLYTLLALAPCTLAKCYHGFSSVFSFDAASRDQSRWMHPIVASHPEWNVTMLSLPGTHDTMTYDIGSEILQCQNWNLTTQLKAGIRYVDIRARLRDDQLQIYHGDGYTGHSYQDVLLTLFDFLEHHEHEFIVMRLKQEGVDLGTNTRSFEQTYNWYHETNPATKDGAMRHIYKPTPGEELPTIGKMKNKIWVLQNFKAASGQPDQYGLAWDGPHMLLEDDYAMGSIYDFPRKYDEIVANMANASATIKKTGNDNQHLWLSHVSASVGVLPIEAAAGPKNRSVSGLNDLTGHWLEDNFGKKDTGSRVGVVILDFPGQRLIEAVVERNTLLL